LIGRDAIERLSDPMSQSRESQDVYRLLQSELTDKGAGSRAACSECGRYPALETYP
jgi:hypothetical protein